ncbi:PAS domain S-box protein [Sphingobacteriales bacterium UPWRP_1]|nr:hypothetical protein BVG80_15545 [Sphingobacteriales bacterium TSM_CSM]PSJ76432.1 PAS domain S-box protein [Sphingobacteriales bacterium UPWRP_1]
MLCNKINSGSFFVNRALNFIFGVASALYIVVVQPCWVFGGVVSCFFTNFLRCMLKPSDRQLAVLIFTGALYCCSVLLAGTILFVMLPQQLQAAFTQMLNGQALLILFFFCSGGAIVVGGVRWFLHNYYLPVEKMKADLRIIEKTNLKYRIPEQGGWQLRQLIRSMNHMGEYFVQEHQQLQSKIDMAKARAEYEKNTLAGLIDELSDGVIVCDLYERVVLYNKKAKKIFGTRQQFIGLGRKFNKIISSELFEQAVTELQRKLAGNFAELEDIDHYFNLTLDGQIINISAVPVFVGETTLNGVIFIARTATEPVRLPAHNPNIEAQTIMATGAKVQSQGRFYDFDILTDRQPAELLNRPLLNLSFTVFDTETTGLNPSGGDELVSLGAVRVVNGHVLENECFYTLIRPNKPIPIAATLIHGISNDMVAAAPSCTDVLHYFYQFAEDTVLAGHNIAFDMRFLKMKEPLTGLLFNHAILDTLLLSSVVHRQQETHHLDALARRFGIEDPFTRRHHALGDALLTAHILVCLFPLLKDMGIVTLGQALEASRNSRYSGLAY